MSHLARIFTVPQKFLFAYEGISTRNRVMTEESSAGSTERIRIAAVGDLHVTRKSQGLFRTLFSQMSRAADVLLLCGDLTDYGHPEEAQILVEELAVANVPVIAVLGNHDFESGKQNEIHDLLCEAGVMLLDGDSCEVNGFGFAGAKGFAGGFGNACLEPWGELSIKQFVQEAVNEALKLEAALAHLETSQNVVVLHYSPIHTTVEGEAPEIIPFLGSRRLEEPLNRFPVQAVFHGHAHHGSLEGKTSTGIPVYNVAMPLLRRKRVGEPPFRIVELPLLPAKREISAPHSVPLSF
jgi:Icc-related predicted phosphoesterase